MLLPSQICRDIGIAHPRDSHGFLCLGRGQKGACNNPIGKDKCNEAYLVVEEIAFEDALNDNMNYLLHQMAGHLFCRLHGAQAGSRVALWQAKIERSNALRGESKAQQERLRLREALIAMSDDSLVNELERRCNRSAWSTHRQPFLIQLSEAVSVARRRCLYLQYSREIVDNSSTSGQPSTTNGTRRTQRPTDRPQNAPGLSTLPSTANITLAQSHSQHGTQPTLANRAYALVVPEVPTAQTQTLPAVQIAPRAASPNPQTVVDVGTDTRTAVTATASVSPNTTLNLLANLTIDAVPVVTQTSSVSPRVPDEEDLPICGACLESIYPPTSSDTVATSHQCGTCRQLTHMACLDLWVARSIETGRPPTCIYCRVNMAT